MALKLLPRFFQFRSLFSNSSTSSMRLKTMEAAEVDVDVEVEVMTLTDLNLEARARHGANLLSSGGLIATPTDTVYGLACDAQNDSAISRIYQIKGRTSTKPVAICVSRISDVYRWGKVPVTSDHSNLLQDLLPGPVTLCFERQPELNANLNPDSNLIGIRIPDHKFILKLAEFHGGPVALTSANFSQQPSTLEVSEFREMWPSLQGIFDGGRLSECEKSEEAKRKGSTVIDLSGSGQGYFRIIREGIAHQKCVQLLTTKYQLTEQFS